MNKAIILLSGGLDSTTMLYYAKSKKFKPYCIIFDYGQRHNIEIDKAKRVARHAKVGYKVVKMSFPWLGSSLIDKSMKIPRHSAVNSRKIPTTYVPARNIIFLSYAVSYAEAIKAGAVFIGANAIDYSGYPDCRPDFFKAYQDVIKKGLKSGVEGKMIKIQTPLLHKSKAQIIRMGLKLKVPYHLTWSCYNGAKKACGVCDSCMLRKKGFLEAGLVDPAIAL